MADEHHYSGIIKIVHSHLLLMAICSLIWSFTLIDGLIRYCGLRELCGTSAGMDDVLPDGIQLGLWNEILILWVIEQRAVAHRTLMSVMEVAIHGNMNLVTLFQWSTKTCTTKTCWTLMNEDVSAGALERSLQLSWRWRGVSGERFNGRLSKIPAPLNNTVNSLLQFTL